MKPQIKVPDFINDLFSDLRDRRLLPLVGVLAIAIVAVPFALSKSTSATSQAGAPAVGDGSDGSLTIVASNPGLRDYRQRLNGDRPTDPFHQLYAGGSHHPAPITGAATQFGGGAGAGASISSGSSGAPSSTGASSTGTEPVSPDTGSGSQGDGGSTGNQGSNSGGEQAPPTPPDDGGSDNAPAYVLSLRVGAPGDTKLRELSAPEPLPSSENAIITFRGLSGDGHKAQFDVSPAVSAIFGDAKCIKGTDRCERVEIERGLPVNFVYGASDKVYRVTVVEIRHND